MADVFEVRMELDPWRDRLWSLIQATPNLDWLLLTKRPELSAEFVPWSGIWPPNIWLGTTVESQRWAERRIPHLATCQVAVRFLSCEPLLSRLDLSQWLGVAVDWVIAGGESGPKARPSHPRWFRELRDQCTVGHVPFHFKQWGNSAPLNGYRANGAHATIHLDDGETMIHLDKKNSGRVLDGKTWDQVPAP